MLKAHLCIVLHGDFVKMDDFLLGTCICCTRECCDLGNAVLRSAFIFMVFSRQPSSNRFRCFSAGYFREFGRFIAKSDAQVYGMLYRINLNRSGWACFTKNQDFSVFFTKLVLERALEERHCDFMHSICR